MDEISFIQGLMREDYDALGFIPTEGVKRYLSQGRYIIQRGNGKPIGYLMYSVPRPFGVLKIAQACIDFDWREKGYGFDVVAEIEKRAKQKMVGSISLRCAADLQSNKFWLASGYELVRTISTQNKRNRDINLYTKILIPDLFSRKG
jgi:hypothetical protein